MECAAAVHIFMLYNEPGRPPGATYRKQQSSVYYLLGSIGGFGKNKAFCETCLKSFMIFRKMRKKKA